MERGMEQAASTISVNANLGVPLFILHPYATLHRPAFPSPLLPHSSPSRCSSARLQWQLALTAAERLFRQLPLAYRAVDGGGRLIGILHKSKARGAGWVGGIGDLFLLPPRNVPSPTCPSRRAIWKWMPRYQIKKSGSFRLNRRLGRSSMGFTSLSMTKPECLSFLKIEDLNLGRTDPGSVVAVILGGGAGTRLFPLTKQRAKPAVRMFLFDYSRFLALPNAANHSSFFFLKLTYMLYL